MLYELIELADQLQRKKKMPPLCYEKKLINWIIDLSGATPYLKGPFEKGEYRMIEAPIRQRSGQLSENNVKPYLLVDDARYVLGVPENNEPKKIREAQLAHQEYVRLIEEAICIIPNDRNALVDTFAKQIRADRNMSKHDNGANMVDRDLQCLCPFHLNDNGFMIKPYIRLLRLNV